MRVVVVDMQNTLFSDAISRALGNFSPDFQVYQSEHPQGTLPLCESVSADILLMETTSHSPWKLEERLQLKDALKAERPDCRIALVVDENTDWKLADQVRQAKKDGEIDQFFYGSVSATYLSAVIDSL
ncbi:MAG: hypothetical protein ACI32F_07415 [Allobaculum sp.]